MIAVALIIAGIAAVAFVAVVIGVQATDHRRRLRDTYPGGFADAFARKVLGVYVRQKPRPSQQDDQFIKWLTRR